MIYALHIVGLGAWSTPGEALGMSIVQLIVITVICAGHGARRHRAARPSRRLAVACSTWRSSPAPLALLGQTWAQAHLPPTRAAIIMSMEPVFAALFAVLLGGEGADGPDARRRPAGARRDADRRARPAPQHRGRGPPPRPVGPRRTSYPADVIPGGRRARAGLTSREAQASMTTGMIIGRRRCVLLTQRPTTRRIDLLELVGVVDALADRPRRAPR